MIDFVYVFRFDNDVLDQALNRLECSIRSLLKQTGQQARIIVANYSKTDIGSWAEQPCIEHYHIPMKDKEPFCKSKMINIAVKKYVRSKYFFLSDIDIVYTDNYIESMLSVATLAKKTYKREVRVIPYVHWLAEDYYSESPNELIFKKWFYNTWSPGNGLVCTKSFKTMEGFDESFKGWGYEDINFNNEISQSDMCIIVENIMTFHLYHPFRKGIYEEVANTREIFQKKLDRTDEEILKNWRIIKKEVKDTSKF